MLKKTVGFLGTLVLAAAALATPAVASAATCNTVKVIRYAPPVRRVVVVRRVERPVYHRVVVERDYGWR